MSAIYYVETNLICIVLLLLLRWQMHRQRENYPTKKIIFDRILWSTITLCAADAIAGICRGRIFYGARIFIEASNLIYFEMLVVIGFLWTLYVGLSLGRVTRLGQKKIWLLAIPLILFTVLALTNPFTHLLFVVDGNNLYARNSGVYFHWAVNWLYMLLPTVQTAIAIAREKSKSRRKALLPLLTFIIAPAIAGLPQMFFYGITSSQVGITISITAIFLIEQNDQIATDALTNLNNRRGLDKYLNDSVQSRSGVRISAIMIDINNFKQINDKFGHLIGDRALLSMACALKRVCNRMVTNTFLCRFGGDEFLIVGRELSDADVARIKALIVEELDRMNAEAKDPYTLTVGMGAASKDCVDMEDAEQLVRLADEAMYEDKKNSRRAYADAQAGSVKNQGRYPRARTVRIKRRVPLAYNSASGTASLGIRQSPRGERATLPTRGPSGMQERLN